MNSTGVPINQQIAVTFSEGMDPATINTATFFSVSEGPGKTPTAGTVTLVGRTATFKPAHSLGSNDHFSGTITTGAKDLRGNGLAQNYT